MKIVMHIETMNPHVVERISEAFSRVGPDEDNAGRLHPFEAAVFTHEDHDGPCCGDVPLWGIAYEPDDDDEDLVKVTQNGTTCGRCGMVIGPDGAIWVDTTGGDVCTDEDGQDGAHSP